MASLQELIHRVESGSTVVYQDALHLEDIKKEGDLLIFSVVTVGMGIRENKFSSVQEFLDCYDALDRSTYPEGNLGGYYVLEDAIEALDAEDEMALPKLEIPEGDVSEGEILGYLESGYLVIRHLDDDYVDFMYKNCGWFTYVYPVYDSGYSEDTSTVFEEILLKAKDTPLKFRLDIPVHCWSVESFSKVREEDLLEDLGYFVANCSLSEEDWNTTMWENRVEDSD